MIIFHFISILYFCLWVTFHTFISALLIHAIKDSNALVVTADQCTMNCTGITTNNLVMVVIEIAKTSHLMKRPRGQWSSPDLPERRLHHEEVRVCRDDHRAEGLCGEK